MSPAKASKGDLDLMTQSIRDFSFGALSVNSILGLLALSSLLISTGCASDDTASERVECNPLGGPGCLLPWPSSAYLVEDATSVTGFRVALPAEAMPVNADSIVVDPFQFNQFDGFPVAGAIIAAFETGVSAEGLPPHTDIAQAMEDSASVVVVNMETGEKLPIFAEPDMNAAVPEERVLLIRPMRRMESGTRYAVGIRNSVKAADGGELPVPAGFAKILAGKSIKHPLAERVEGGYEQIFGSLAAVGLPQEELVLAWDFVTASDEFLTQDLLAMRTQALAAMEAQTFSYDIQEQSNDNPAEVLRVLTGTYDTAMFLTEAETDRSSFNRGADGLPELSGIGTANLGAIIPKCVETAQLPIPVTIFGHGMFGNAADSLDNGFLQTLANEECTVVVGGDWIGLTNRQFAAVAFAMNDLNRGAPLTDKLSQAVINFIVLQRMLRGPLLTSDAFQVGGEQVLDPTRVYYFGASLGGIMGGVYMALDPDVTRGALGVPGGPWSLLFERSVFWPPLRITMKGAYPDPWDYQQNVALMGMLFEKVDPMAMAHRVLVDPLPDTPPKQLLLYMALGDALVSNIASDVLARTLNIPVIGPSVATPFGFTATTDAVPNGYAIYDESPEIVPPNHNALEDLEYNDTHQDVHEWGAVQRQVYRLLTEGVIESECSLEGAPAPCLCATGACE